MRLERDGGQGGGGGGGGFFLSFFLSFCCLFFVFFLVFLFADLHFEEISVNHLVRTSVSQHSFLYFELHCLCGFASTVKYLVSAHPSLSTNFLEK